MIFPYINKMKTKLNRTPDETETLDASVQTFIRGLPKVELHLHLEGAIRPETAFALMRRNQSGDLPERSDQVRDLYRFDDLSQFVIAMRSVTNHVRTLDDLQLITRQMLADLIAQNTFYVEFDCAVQKYVDLGLDLKEIIDTLYYCTLEVKDKILARLIINLQRAHGAEKTAVLVDRVARMAHPFIAGVGLSGDETLYPQKLFIRAFAAAKEAGLNRTVHAGEALGPESILDALDLLHSQRIDHGTQAFKDQNLVQRLKAEAIPLTQCISSNVRLHIVKSVDVHPFAEYLRNGLVVALHTDDPQVFAVTLNSEYELAARAFDLTREEIVQILCNGIRGSFLPHEVQNTLIDQFQKSFSRLQAIPA